MYRAKSKVIESTDEFIDVLSPIVTSKGFSDILDSEFVIKELTYKNNPPKIDLKNISAVEITDLALRGKLQPIDWKSINNVFDKLERNVGRLGRLDVSIDFDEQASELSNEGEESVSITEEFGKYFFTFFANGSRSSVDHEYAIEVFENMFKVMELPITLIREGDEYSLEHTDEGYLWVSHASIFGKNPKLFYCELSGIDKEGLINKLKYFVEQFVIGSITEVSWSAGTSSRNDNNHRKTSKVVELYNTVIDANLPAQEYTMCPSFKLTTINGIEAIRTLCTEKNTMTARYGVINFGDVKAMVSICVSANGYCIEAGTKDQLAIEKLSSLLNIDFMEN